MIRDKAAGMSSTDIAAKYGIKYNTVRNILGRAVRRGKVAREELGMRSRQRKAPQRQVTDAEYIARMKKQSIVTASGCWEWHGWVHPKGYGATSYRGKNWRVHRLSYVLHKGPIPPSHHVCHSCDNRVCWNPDHLWAGTLDENNKDMFRKGRTKRWTQKTCKHGHPMGEESRIGKNQWRHCKVCARIRSRIKAGWPEDLARKLGVTPHGFRPVNAKATSQAHK